MVHQCWEISIIECKDLASGIFPCKLASVWKQNLFERFCHTDTELG